MLQRAKGSCASLLCHASFRRLKETQGAEFATMVVMRISLLLSVLGVGSAFAQQVIVNEAPTPAETARYQVLKALDLTLKLDTQTGATWSLCVNTKKQSKAAWCKFNAPLLPAGPSGRYRIAEAFQIMLIDSVSGRSWQRCEDPTPEKRLAWCPIED
jgi:hypothetical protein